MGEGKAPRAGAPNQWVGRVKGATQVPVIDKKGAGSSLAPLSFYYQLRALSLFHVAFFLYNGDMFLRKTTLSLKTSMALSSSSMVFIMPKENISVPCAAA